jgi:inosine/xanthosine triphosphate pyrophosphatase family protein
VSTITNAGVRSLQSTTALPSGRTAGAGVNINGATGDNLKVTNTGVISISSGVGITVSLDAASGDVTITNAAPAVNAFTQIEVNGDSSNRLAADAASDVLNITSDTTITLTKTVGTDTLNIAVNPVFDLRGSVFADDSTLLVDAVSGIIPAAVVSGTFTGNVIGNVAGNVIGSVAGNVIGDISGSVFADDSTLLVDGILGKIICPVDSTFINVQDRASFEWSGVIKGVINADGDGNFNFIGQDYNIGLISVGGNVQLYSTNGTIEAYSPFIATAGIEGDLTGSVFADNSTLLVDAINGVIPGYVSISELQK